MSLGPDAPKTPRLPFGLFGMLALVAGIESAIAGRPGEFTTVWADDWRRTAEAAGREALGRDVLCFGDSLVKFSVLPRVIEAKSGLRAYNLAVNAGTMPSAYFLLKRAVGSGAKPRAVVADFFALMLADEPHLSVRTYPDLASPGDCLDLAWTARDPWLLSATLLGKLLPSYKCRFEVRARVFAALGGAPGPPPLGPSRATWKREAGAQPMPSVGWRGPADPTVVASLAPVKWKCDDLNAIYFEKFLALADAEGLPVYWLMPPLGPDIHARRRQVGADEAYTRLAREAQRRHPRLVVLDARQSGYDDSVHVDAIHLDRRGAAVLSGDLAAILDGRLKGSDRDLRWVDLPPLAGRGVEEVAGGRESVTSGAARAR